MKLHDLRPAEGSRTPRTRVGRGIAAGKGKTAGRGTKGQKSRAGGGIPPWFEGGQTPLHMRIPKLRGFKNRGRIEYEVVNVGDIGRLAEQGAFDDPGAPKGRTAKAAPATVNQDVLREAGLVRTLAKPLKILGQGDIGTPLFVVADAFSKSATTKIEGAGGTVSILERPTGALAALGLTPADASASEVAPAASAEPKPRARRAAAVAEADAVDEETTAEETTAEETTAEGGAATEEDAPAEVAPRRRSKTTPHPAIDEADAAAASDEVTETSAAQPADEA
jgi:large subunit ribosomal protein L15